MVSQGYLVAAGDPSKFSCKWCNDSGANRHIAADISEFTSNYRAVNISLTVAKQHISMQALVGSARTPSRTAQGHCFRFIYNSLHLYNFLIALFKT